MNMSRKVPKMALSVGSSFLYLVSLGLMMFVFDNFRMTPSLAIPVFAGILLSDVGGFTSSISNAIMLAFFTVHLFGDDTSRLYQNLVLNSILFILSGWQSTARRQQTSLAMANQAKADLLNSANGNLLKVEEAYLLAQSALEHYPGNKDDQSYIALVEARGILANLQTMVKGWRVLYREKQAVKEHYAAEDAQES